MLPPKGAKGAMVAASSQKQGKTGWLFGLCVVMAILALIAGCEKKAPKRQSAPLTAPRSVSAAATTPPPATAAPAITEAATPTAALPTTSPDGTPVEESLPWQGMPAELLDKTWLGTPERTGEIIDGGLFDGGVTYYWYSTNGLHDVLFSATVRDGEVINVAKWNTGRNYWEGYWGLPNRNASGEAVKAAAPTYESPYDYDSPDDYADTAEDYFRWLGCDDPYDAAYQHWEDLAG